ncbi:flavodoxin family protein [candidate division KSB1 bacterium]|nr:flavodoxin family protein [candidate division KSB1 bacterium]MBL7093907.1 flavodoxin family protein [candidate division KSB1 bacterium]
MLILAFIGSPRPKGNSTLLLNKFIKGAKESGATVETIDTNRINIKYCRGCLKCNLAKRCTIRNDDFEELSKKILTADTLVFSSPVYFHHLPAGLKAIIDRFRSFNHVQILEDGLKHTPWVDWRKNFILLLSLGKPSTEDTEPIVDLFNFICEELGSGNKLTTIIGTRLAVPKQVIMEKHDLITLYEKLKIPVHLVEKDYEKNQALLKECFELGKKIK